MTSSVNGGAAASQSGTWQRNDNVTCWRPCAPSVTGTADVARQWLRRYVDLITSPSGAANSGGMSSSISPFASASTISGTRRAALTASGASPCWAA
ncbi:hypothetical protein G6F68_020598 [Rhizopus microsporus]|nr:hypothetical protein G6F68_020598 [Rhizopus microsporus]